ncbi:RidA family protein [Aestuariivita sp.]|jgi:enamine deaminase RidA (YjgF/YER057c/UK114 family)|uniref:RidA family protein n=1 Tax=Aestuariivita sp. TaxID=1872407 RepID=UPI00216C5D9F|nr:RidA family protein [Aestuariivita sp.]MCE8006130.1 RidA family protein [Aestuariivita sp.]
MPTTLTKTGGSARFSAIAAHGGQIHLAGQVSQLKDADIVEQSRDVFSKVDALLAQAGSRKDDIISVQVWLTDIADYDGMNSAWDDWVRNITPPTRVCVEARLAKPHYKVEVLVIAAAEG